MRFEWDAAKAVANIEKHGVAFEKVRGFDFSTALAVSDDRADYGEARMVAFGFISERLHVLVYTQRGAALRVISLRKANRKEIASYVESL